MMGAFHLVEPIEGNSTSPEATQLAASGVFTDVERGRAPWNVPELEGGRRTILTLEMLRELVKDLEFEIQITEDEIMDRSKGDALSKTILLLQSSWFMLQCIARRAQGLSLTHLELTTLALTSLTCITLALWWDKPLGVQVPVRVSMKRKLTDAERDVERVSDFVSSDSSYIICDLQRGRSDRSVLLPYIQDFFESRATAIRDITLCRSEGNIFVAWLITLPLAIVALLLLPIVAFAFAFASTIGDMLGASSSFPADATHVPTFYVPEHRYSEFLRTLLLMALATIFGGIHCAGWNLPFPTFAEQKLWRIASLAITIIPIGTFLFVGIIIIIVKLLTIFKSGAAAESIIASVTSIILMLMYASARLILLGLAIALLRHLPPTAFIAVDWTKYYPHIF